MTIRRRLPNRRASELIDYDVSGRRHTASLGFYADGMLGEAFLYCSKSGSDASIAMLEAGIALSFALQHGADIDELRKAMPRTSEGAPEGAIGHLLDLLARRPMLGLVPVAT